MNLDGPFNESQQLPQSTEAVQQPQPMESVPTETINDHRGIKRSFNEMNHTAELPKVHQVSVPSDLPPAINGAPEMESSQNTNTAMNVDNDNNTITNNAMNSNTECMQSVGEQSASTNANAVIPSNPVPNSNNNNVTKMTNSNPIPPMTNNGNGGCIVINKKASAVTPPEEKDWSHITEADLELDSFSCPRCSKSFKTTNDLFVHMRETYDDPTVCQVCGKNLNCMANVLSHSYLHQDVKPYKCPKCKYRTRTRFNLRVHFGSCAKLEKFSYKRGQGPKRRRTINTKNRKRAKRSSRRRLDLDDSGILSHMYDDILNQLADSGPYNAGERDVSCLVQVHIQHFPRTNADGTDRFYQQNDPTKRHQALPAPPITDVNQFYAGAPPPKPQW